MGCRCCRMIKSYIYDPSVPVDVHGRKRDPAGSSLYQSHQHHAGGGDPVAKKQGFHNLGFSSGKHGDAQRLEADNNQINRLREPPPGGDTMYILHPNGPGPGESPPLACSTLLTRPDKDRADGRAPSPVQRPPEDRSRDERDEGVESTPEYTGDTGDDESILSGDVHTSSTSLSSGQTGVDNSRARNASTTESGISMTKDEEEEEEEQERRSVTDSMVAEAIAALEAATEGEDYD